MLSASKEFHFCYSHRLPEYKGKCASQHGHNAVFVPVFSQVPGQYNSMVVDFNVIKSVVGPIIEKLDHKDLTGFFDNSPECVMLARPGDSGKDFVPATAEVMITWLCAQIGRTKLGPHLVHAKLSETPTSWVYWHKPNIVKGYKPDPFEAFKGLFPKNDDFPFIVTEVPINSLDDLYREFARPNPMDEAAATLKEFMEVYGRQGALLSQKQADLLCVILDNIKVEAMTTKKLPNNWIDRISRVLDENS